MEIDCLQHILYSRPLLCEMYLQNQDRIYIYEWPTRRKKAEFLVHFFFANPLNDFKQYSIQETVNAYF